MAGANRTVFISYRRSMSSYIARAIFQDLRAHGYDVFMDVESINAGAFDTIILTEIAARMHFVVVLAPGTVERWVEPGDWFRREIEYAIDLQRNIVPVLAHGFRFEDAAPYLTGKLSELPRYNALTLHHEYFDEAMERLRNRFLQQPVRADLRISPHVDLPQVLRKIARVLREPIPTRTQLSAEGYYSRASQKYRQGDYEQALEDCNEAIRLNPLYCSAFSLRGAIRDALGDWDGAIADCTMAIRLQPDHVEAYINRGIAYDHRGDHPHALEDYAEALRLQPDYAEAYYYRGVVYEHEGDIDRAIADYTEAIRLRPEYATAYRSRSALYHRQGDHARAEADYARARELGLQW